MCVAYQIVKGITQQDQRCTSSNFLKTMISKKMAKCNKKKRFSTYKKYQGKAVMKKWVNVRDSFQRSERKKKASLRSSDGHPPKTYIYGKQLQFLKKTTQGRPMDDSFSNDAETQQPPEHFENETYANSTSEVLAEDDITFIKADQLNKKKRKLNPVEPDLDSAIQQRPNRHTNFSNGIIPSLETFDDDEVVEFQLKVLQVISDIKKVKRLTANLYSHLQQPPEHFENETYENSASEVLAEDDITFKKADQLNKKKRKPNPVEPDLDSAIQQRPNRHTSFFNGIIPSLETFDDDEVVEFQLKVLQVISDIKKFKRLRENLYSHSPPSTSKFLPFVLPLYHDSSTQLLPPSTAEQFCEKDRKDIRDTYSSTPSDISETSSMDSFHF